MTRPYLTVALLSVILLLPLARASSANDVDTRIGLAAQWIAGQQIAKSGYSGFLRGTTPPWNSRIYTEDQALIVLALSDYHATHYDSRYDALFNIAMNFVEAARINGRDFSEYYDISLGLWGSVGDLYSWDAYAISANAAAIYKLVSINTNLSSGYSTVIAQLEQTLNNYRREQRSDGAWSFNVAGSHQALTRENAMMLAGIVYIALFENTWGNKQRATDLALVAQATAKWLFSTQQIALGAMFGGFPHSDSNSTQVAEENGEIMYGVDTYYSAIGVLLPHPSPSVFDARRVMGDWVQGFVVEMMDPYGGMYLARFNETLLKYPKTIRAVSWVMQALADIWIDIGNIGQGNIPYRDVTQATYNWTTGNNELNVDMQQARALNGTLGGFYDSIEAQRIDKDATVAVAASALYAFNRADYIQIPEFPTTSALLVGTMIMLLVVGIRKGRNAQG